MNPAHQSAKIQLLLQQSTNRSQSSTSEKDMSAPPPAYASVVGPNASIPNNPLYEQEEDNKDEDETPEITINAATQIRGHGNIISIAQMDSARIASLIATLLNGEKVPDVLSSQQTPEVQAQAPAPAPTATLNGGAKKEMSKFNITVNCGATIIGDRNIVGPGLGDIARQMQMSQRNQALHAQQRQQQQQQQQQRQPSPPGGQRVPSLAQYRDSMFATRAAIAQHHGPLYAPLGPQNLHPPTPPMSRTSSVQSEGPGGVKRKAESDDDETVSKRQC